MINFNQKNLKYEQINNFRTLQAASANCGHCVHLVPECAVLPRPSAVSLKSVCCFV